MLVLFISQSSLKSPVILFDKAKRGSQNGICMFLKNNQILSSLVKKESYQIKDTLVREVINQIAIRALIIATDFILIDIDLKNLMIVCCFYCKVIFVSNNIM